MTACRRRSPRPPIGSNLVRLTTATLGAGALALTTALAASPAQAAPAVTPEDGKFLIKGAGYGHGHGMSQYGAYGAARQGKDWKAILGFYYPGTTRTTLAKDKLIKVWITADDDDSLRVLPAAGLTVRDGAGHRYAVPTGDRYRSWRISRSGPGYRLAWRDTDGEYHTSKVDLDTSTWSFSTTAGVVKVRVPGGATREYRGSVALVKRGGGGRTVNTVLLEDYVRSVVPAEMPTSWAKDAVAAQAVAARSFAVHTQEATSHPGYDVCDTTNCQVYPGMAVTPSGGRRVVREDKAGDAATRATAGVVLSHRGKVALTQFATSDGGASSSGGVAYLKAQDDPYDGVVTSQAWTRTVTTSTIARAWPSVGTVEKVTVAARDGSGPWGGRVTKITVSGSKSSVTVSGGAFQGRLGLRSSLFTVATP